MKRDWIVSETGSDHKVTVDGPLADGRFRVTNEGVTREVDAQQIRPGTWSLIIDGKSFVVDLDRRRDAVAASVGASELVVKVEDALHRRLAAAAAPRERPRGETLRAPIAGKVVKLLCAVGDSVAPGTAVIVLEAMKMENEIVTERGGTVTAVNKQAGQAVDTGDVLIELV